MFRLTALALLVPILAVAAPVPKEKEKDLYMPVTVGAKWVMESKIGERTVEITETVTKVEEKDGVYTVTVERDTGFRKPQEDVFEVSVKGIARPASGGAKEPQIVLKLGGKAGDTWECEMPGLGGRTTTRKFTLGKEEEVTVPAGKFKAIRVDTETAQGKTTAWHAAGVGVVKQEIEQGQIKSTQELKSFTPGKEEKKDDKKKEEPKKDK